MHQAKKFPLTPTPLPEERGAKVQTPLPKERGTCERSVRGGVCLMPCEIGRKGGELGSFGRFLAA